MIRRLKTFENISILIVALLTLIFQLVARSTLLGAGSGSFLLLLITMIYVVPNIAQVVKVPKAARFLRYGLMLLPYMIPFFWGSYSMGLRFHLIGCLAGILLGLLMVVTYMGNIQKMKLLFSTEAVLARPRITGEDMGFYVFKVVSSAIFQELFYRVFLYVAISETLGPFPGIMLTAGLFTFEHYFNPVSRKVYDRKNYLYHFILSIVNSVLYIVTHSIWASILAHLAFNSLQAFLFMYQILVWKKYEHQEIVQEIEL